MGYNLTSGLHAVPCRYAPTAKMSPKAKRRFNALRPQTAQQSWDKAKRFRAILKTVDAKGIVTKWTWALNFEPTLEELLRSTNRTPNEVRKFRVYANA